MLAIWKLDQSFLTNRGISVKEQVSPARSVEIIWFLVAVDTEWASSITILTVIRRSHSQGNIDPVAEVKRLSIPVRRFKPKRYITNKF